jgi:hypothetical protein
VLLATTIERISNQPFNLFMEEKVFKPLNMNNTFVRIDHEKIIKNRAYHYWPLPNGRLEKMIASMTVYGNAGIYSTVEDLVKWLNNFNNSKVGNATVIQQMYEFGYLRNKDTIDYAFGLNVLNYKGNNLIGHAGGLFSYRTYLGHLPDLDLGIMVLSNWYKATPCEAALKILNHWVPEKNEEYKQNRHIKTDISSFEGSYITEDGLQFQLYSINGELYAQLFGELSVSKLIQVSTSEFVGIISPWCADLKISFSNENKQDFVGEFKLYGKSSFKKISSSYDIEWKPEKSQLQLYEGKYHSRDLNTVFTITLAGNQLIVSNDNHEKIILTPKDIDMFSGNRWFFENIKFTRSNKGNINAMLISGYRIKNIPFEKK